MDHDTVTKTALRERVRELKTIYESARFGANRWAELDSKHRFYAADIDRASTVEEGQAIFLRAKADIEAIGAADLAQRESERQRQRAAVDQARHDDLCRQQRNAWVEQVGAPIRKGLRALESRVDANLNGLHDDPTEARLRQAIQKITDALTSLSATLSLETRASITRSNDADKAAAA